MKKTYLTVIMMLVSLLSQTAESETVNVDLNTAMQTIRGFGGMNFPRWIGTLTDAQVDKAFGNGSGQLGFTIMRIDIPPNSGDWSGEVSAAARAKSNGAIVFASPWSPPASMKTNGSLIQGELKTDSYDDFANYLSDFANYMSSNGASLYAVSVQNEPDWLPDYESCGWSASQMQTFLNNNASVIPVKVIAPETVHYKSDYVSAVASSEQCDIVAVHLYGGTITYYSGKEYWATEFNENNTDWTSALNNTGVQIHNCMCANMSAYLWWYIRRSYSPLDESGNITNRGYVMAHFSKYVRPGYVRVGATANPSSGVYVTAYKSGSTLVIVALNTNGSSQSVTFSISGGFVGSYTKYESTSGSKLSNKGSVGSTDTLAASSINTFVGTISYEDDTTPPTPDPLTWATEPTATGDSSIEMTATTATDISGVEYYFDCLTAGGHDSGWQDSTYYEDTGLDPETEYSYRVMARDKSPAQNETGWSSTLSATTDPPDTTPPTPNPMTWATVPTATGPGSIIMTASTAYDTSGVEYYFNCLTAGGHDSSWQDSTTYTDTGLAPSTSYTYSVQARDKSLNQNVTGWSSSLAATTQAPIIELLGSWVAGTTHTQESGDNRALLFFVTVEKASTITLNSVTYGGRTMTKIIERTADTSTQAYTAAFILNDANLALAANSTFVPSWSSTPAEYSYQSVFLSNVNQTTPVGPNDSNAVVGNVATLKTSSLATGNGDMAFVAATCGNVINYSVNNGFTEAIESDMASSTGTAGYKSATGANETPSVTVTGTVNRQVIIGFVVQAAKEWLYGDLTHDNKVDMNDLFEFRKVWLVQDCNDNNILELDLDDNCTVNFYEYSFFAQNWYKEIE